MMFSRIPANCLMGDLILLVSKVNVTEPERERESHYSSCSY